MRRRAPPPGRNVRAVGSLPANLRVMCSTPASARSRRSATRSSGVRRGRAARLVHTIAPGTSRNSDPAGGRGPGRPAVRGHRRESGGPGAEGEGELPADVVLAPDLQNRLRARRYASGGSQADATRPPGGRPGARPFESFRPPRWASGPFRSPSSTRGAASAPPDPGFGSAARLA